MLAKWLDSIEQEERYGIDPCGLLHIEDLSHTCERELLKIQVRYLTSRGVQEYRSLMETGMICRFPDDAFDYRSTQS